MNEEESDSSDVILDLNGAEPTEEKINPARKFCYFLTESGHSLNFVLLADNLTDTTVAEVSEQIQTHMGTVSTSKQDVGNNTAVLVADEATTWDYSGEVFALSYIGDCIAAGKVKNITEYLKGKSKWYVENFDYMTVIYNRRYSWQTIPSMYKLSKPVETDSRTPWRDNSDSDSSLDSIHSCASTHSINFPRSNKHTKSQYTWAEKEAMLRYVVDTNQYNRVKGKQIYKDMEAANICPIRTWQSLKDHFLRCLPKEIDRFSFLTTYQKRNLKEKLLPYK